MACDRIQLRDEEWRWRNSRAQHGTIEYTHQPFQNAEPIPTDLKDTGWPLRTYRHEQSVLPTCFRVAMPQGPDRREAHLHQSMQDLGSDLFLQTEACKSRPLTDLVKRKCSEQLAALKLYYYTMSCTRLIPCIGQAASEQFEHS